MPLVAQGWLVTFGIAPNAPETGYGWIQIGEKLQRGVNRVAQFVEKPPLDKAILPWPVPDTDLPIMRRVDELHLL